jgi:ubiquinol oxidase
MSASPDNSKSLSWHHEPQNFSDKFALKFVKFLRFCADSFFAKRYGHRAIVLETVAAVPWRTMEA